MLLLKKCCWCCSLKTGAITTGAIGIILSLFCLILAFAGPVAVKSVMFQEVDPIWSVVILCLDSFILVVVSILLIVGAIIRNVWCIIPYIIVGLIEIISLLVSFLYTTVVYFRNNDILEGSFCFVLGVALLVFFAYLWVVTLSFFIEVKDEQNQGFRGRP